MLYSPTALYLLHESLMVASITIVGFIFALAWLQQQFLNRMIAADREAMRKLHAEFIRKRAESQVAPSDAPLPQ